MPPWLAQATCLNLNCLCSTMLTETLDASCLVHGDAPLSATGEKQIQFKLRTKAADFLAVLPDVVYSSPLRRALRTALVAYPAKKIKVDPRLREIHASAGKTKTELETFVAATCPNRKAKVDLSRVPAEKPWWSTAALEDEGGAAQRIQKVLKDVHKFTVKGKKVALVAHGGVFRSMVGKMKPFPKEWGSPRGFPRNFKPYFAAFCPTSSAFKVIPATKEDAVLILVRHGHSRSQAANTLARKIQKFNRAPTTPEAAKALDAKIRRFNAAV